MIYYLGYDRFLLIFFTDYSHFMDRITLPSTDTARGKGKWKNNNRLMPHIRRTTHIMKFAHRNSFDFHFFNAR